MLDVADIVLIVYCSLQFIIILSVIILSLKAVDDVAGIYAKDGCGAALAIWFRTSFKMRGIYSSFMVHVFDIITDILVIIELYNQNEESTAELSIMILVFGRIISAVAVFVTEINNRALRSFLQLFDLLIIFELYFSHKRIVEQIVKVRNNGNSSSTNNNDNHESIGSTIRFKNLRFFEAIYESIPQAILQLAYVMQSSKNEFNNTLFIVSICQSIVSLSMSVVKLDQVYI